MRKPLELTAECLGDTYAVGVGSLRIFGAGSTLQQAVNDFWGNLASVYSSYTTTPPDELSRDGRQYLKRLRSLVA